jgi:hypothetical protein
VLNRVGKGRLRQCFLIAAVALIVFVCFAWLLTADDLNGLLDTRR